MYAALLLSLVLASCQKSIVGKTMPNTPTNNYQALWEGIDQWYGLFEARPINWDSVHQAHAAAVHDNMSTAALYDVLCEMITPLNDPHVFLQPTTHGLPRYESSVFFRENKVQQDFSISNIKANYIPGLKTVDTSLHYGITADNIGYIHFGEFGMPLKFYKAQMATIMSALGNTRGLVIDIRNHAGGDDEVSRYIAGWFAAEKKLFMTVRKRNGRGRTDFTSPQSWYTDPQTKEPYSKPICVLTTRWTTSAGETFTWALNTQLHVTHMGDTTAGGFSDVVSRELPNGWLYFVSVGDYRNANGQSEEGKGIAPAIRIINLPEEVAAGKDKVLEAALLRLR